MMPRRWSAAALALAAALTSACGSTVHPARAAARGGPEPRATATACTAPIRLVLSRLLGVPTAAIVATPFTASSAAPSCRLSARWHGRTIAVTANVDAAPQAYYRLEREIVETGQAFAAQREIPVPEHVAGLGLDAAWFQTEPKLMTTDGTRLITVGVHWPGAAPRSERSLAIAVARASLAPQG